MSVEQGYAYCFIALAAFVTVKLRKLNMWGGVAAWFVASSIFLGAGYPGLLLLGTFFVLGTGATSFKIRTKEHMGAAEKDKGKRNAGQVFANGGVAAITGILMHYYPQQKMVLLLMMAASLAAATADTLSSELGTLYGKKFYNIRTLKSDRRGENGVISMEGSLFGLAGSAVIAVIFSIASGWSMHFFWILLGGTIGNLADSLLGATLERRRYLGNDAVNFLNTVTGALAALALAAW